RLYAWRHARWPARQTDRRGDRVALGRALGARWHLPLRPHLGPLDLRDRHPAAHGQRITPRRPRLLLHPHGPDRALSPDARRGGLLPDGVGRQRPAHGAAGAELLRRALRPVAALRPALRAAAGAAEGADPHPPPELRGALPAADGGGREGVRGAVAAPGP